MKTLRSTCFTFFSKGLILLLVNILSIPVNGIKVQACDIAVVSASASPDGRPFIWKNRDKTEAWEQEIGFHAAKDPAVGGSLHVQETLFPGLLEISSGGVNEAGFAIANTTVYTPDYFSEAFNTNTDLMAYALNECITVEDFEQLLNTWHQRSPLVSRIISGNFVVIDAFGGAALYEAYSLNGFASPVVYEKFDANTATDENGDFVGFVNRVNSHQWVPENKGDIREERAYELMLDMVREDRLSNRNVMQVVAKDVCGQVEKDVDESSFYTTDCISRAQTNMALMVDGVAPGEDARLTTFWVILGEPAIGVCTPFFPAAREVSYFAVADDFFGPIPVNISSTCLMNIAIVDKELELYDNNGYSYTLMDYSIDYSKLVALQSWTFPFEDLLFNRTDEYLADMADNPDLITVENLAEFSHYCISYAYENVVHGFSEHDGWEFQKPWGAPWDADGGRAVESKLDITPADEASGFCFISTVLPAGKDLK